jgi:hypothetical protein
MEMFFNTALQDGLLGTSTRHCYIIQTVIKYCAVESKAFSVLTLQAISMETAL